LIEFDVPGKGIGGEAKVLGLSDRLYGTDSDVLESMKYPGDAEKINKWYDIVFFPYQKARDAFFEGYRELYQRVEKAVKKVLKGESTSYAQRFLGIAFYGSEVQWGLRFACAFRSVLLIIHSFNY